MKSTKDMIMADAIETAIKAEQKNIKLLRIICVESVAVVILAIIAIFK